jgi:hypothetical protein
MSRKSNKTTGEREASRVVIEYGDRPYVVKQGEREIARFVRVDHAQQFAAAAPQPDAQAQWGAFDSDGKLRATFDSESEAHFYVRNRGHMYGGSYRALASTRTRADALAAALRSVEQDAAAQDFDPKLNAISNATLAKVCDALAAWEKEAK